MCARYLSAAGEDVGSLLRAARTMGFGAVQFPSVAAISPSLDGQVITDVAALAAATEMEIWLGAGMLNAYHLDRCPDLVCTGSGEEMAEDWSGYCPPPPYLENVSPMVVIGMETDRFDQTVAWSEQLRATAALFSRLPHFAALVVACL